MKNIRLIVFTGVLIKTCVFLGQDSIVRRLKLHEVSFTGGIVPLNGWDISLEKVQGIYQESQLLNQNLDSFKRGNLGGTYETYFASLETWYKISDKKKSSYSRNVRLRLGVSLYDIYTLIGSYKDYRRKTFDTITNPQGYPQYLDSVWNNSLFVSQRSTQVRFSGGIIIEGNPEGRFSLHMGFLASAGCSFYSKSGIYLSERLYYSSSSGVMTTAYEKHRQEFLTGRPTIGGAFMMPAGFDLRMTGNSRINRVWLFAEMKHAFHWSYHFNTGMFFADAIEWGIGIRSTW